MEREVREDGQYACTDYRVLARSESHTFLELQLHTGRTHQIRVHMAYIGHPLVGMIYMEEHVINFPSGIALLCFNFYTSCDKGKNAFF